MRRTQGWRRASVTVMRALGSGFSRRATRSRHSGDSHGTGAKSALMMRMNMRCSRTTCEPGANGVRYTLWCCRRVANSCNNSKFVGGTCHSPAVTADRHRSDAHSPGFEQQNAEYTDML